MEGVNFQELSVKSQAAALKATDAEEQTQILIRQGRERVGQQGGQKVENKAPNPLQSNSEQGSWWQGLVANISNSLQIGSSGFDDKVGQVTTILERNDPRPPIEEPKPTAINIEKPPEEDQAKFTWNGLWSKVSNAVTSVLRLKKLLLKLILLANKAAEIQLAISRLITNRQKKV